jgi:hypothetical protein
MQAAVILGGVHVPDVVAAEIVAARQFERCREGIGDVDPIASGRPWRSMASSNASHTGAAVARATTLAHTQNPEWSSIPVTTLERDPSARRTPKVTSICHSSMGRERSQRLYSLGLRFLGLGSMSTWRTRQR